MTISATWWTTGGEPPRRVALATGHHLRPIRASDVDLHLAAVWGSRERLWSIFGERWGWPAADLHVSGDRADLERHETLAAERVAFVYPGETELLGCVHIDPPSEVGGRPEVSWWVVDLLVGGPIEAALNDFVPRWIAEEWPPGPSEVTAIPEERTR